METKIQGYLECNGIISRVDSIEDIRSFLSQFGESVHEITEEELDDLSSLAVFEKCEGAVSCEYFSDDCDVSYSKNPQILKKGNWGLSTYKVKEGTVAIANYAFNSCDGDRKGFLIKYCLMPDSLLTIGEGAFLNNCELEKIILPNTLIKIGIKAFWNCRRLKKIVIPASVEYIGSKAFRYCENLESVKFNGIPSSLGSGIFEDCKSLKEIIIPVGSKAFFLRELFPIDESVFIEE